MELLLLNGIVVIGIKILVELLDIIKNKDLI